LQLAVAVAGALAPESIHMVAAVAAVLLPILIIYQSLREKYTQ
jgi:hypothetical protein